MSRPATPTLLKSDQDIVYAEWLAANGLVTVEKHPGAHDQSVHSGGRRGAGARRGKGGQFESKSWRRRTKKKLKLAGRKAEWRARYAGGKVKAGAKPAVKATVRGVVAYSVSTASQRAGLGADPSVFRRRVRKSEHAAIYRDWVAVHDLADLSKGRPKMALKHGADEEGMAETRDGVLRSARKAKDPKKARSARPVMAGKVHTPPT